MSTIETDWPEEQTLEVLYRTFQEWKETSRGKIRVLKVENQGELQWTTKLIAGKPKDSEHSLEFKWEVGFPRGQIPELNLNPKFTHYLLINCYMPITVLETGKNMVRQHDLTIAVLELTIWWEVGSIKKLQVPRGTGCRGNTEAVPDPVAGR